MREMLFADASQKNHYEKILGLGNIFFFVEENVADQKL